jgi:hypothetical protein
MSAQKRDISFWADQIANHGFDKHVTKKQEFTNIDYGSNQGVSNKDQYRSHALSSLEDRQTLGFIGDNKREIYYNKNSNSASIVNNIEPKESTHFRPKDGENWFKSTYDNENGRLQDKGQKIGPIIPGGYYAHHPEQALSRSGEGKPPSGQSVPTPAKFETTPPKEPSSAPQAQSPTALADDRSGDKQADQQPQQEVDKRPGERLIDRYRRPEPPDTGKRR